MSIIKTLLLIPIQSRNEDYFGLNALIFYFLLIMKTITFLAYV